MFRRLIRTSTRCGLTLKDIRLSRVTVPERSELRLKVQSYYDLFEESKLKSSTFNEEHPVTPIFESSGLKSFSINDISNYIQLNSNALNMKVFEQDVNYHGTSGQSHLLIDIEGRRARLGLVQELKKSVRTIKPTQRIIIDGVRGQENDWIVMDLGLLYIHIFDPECRKIVNLDSKLSEESNEVPDDAFLSNVLASSIPRYLFPKSLNHKK